jgi:uncharacterized iron-regulated protein
MITLKIMKTMTCRQMGGACDLEFDADTFEEMAEMSKNHGMEMFQKDDQPHLDAMKEMMSLKSSPNAMQDWFEGKRNEFNALPKNK